MPQYVVTDTELTAVANAIRSKGGTEADLEWPSAFVSAIGAITTGGGGGNQSSGGQTASKTVSYLKWKITKLRDVPAANAIQVAEFYIYQNSEKYSWHSNASISSNMTGESNQGIENLIDNNVSTKYCSTAWGSSQIGECNIIISLGESITLDNDSSYSFVTPNDAASRDPISWVLYGSADGTTWEELDSRNDTTVPTGRVEETFPFPMSEIHSMNGGPTNILSGTDAPTANVGSDGSIYLRYEEYEELPSGYTSLEYVQFVNGAYINTGIAPTNHFVEMQVKDLSYGNDKHWFGTDNSPSHPHFTTYSNRYYWGTGSAENNGGSWSSGVHKLEFNKGSSNAVIIDDITLGSGSNISSTSIILIGRRTNYANAENLQVHYFKMRDRTDDSLVMHLVPAKDSNDVIGFYDLVSETFFTNAGTGTFISGPEIGSKPIVSIYLKVDGAWQSLIGSDIDDVNTGGGSI